MKIQKGIVKYKDRSDIVCTYGLTDDGLQYYFLDETDSKKFSNGNRIVTTALVEAIDPMVKANNVGVIDENGAIIVPFENRSIRPVNDNVIVVEKAVPTSQNVLDAVELRNDATAATKLVSTPAVIKDKINAQMGVEGKYIFNDQFSEATVCDINGTNLVGGESYSFISMANDKLYMCKNIPELPVVEFSLTTYEVVAAPAANAIDVSTAVVDQQVVEDALTSQTGVEPNAVDLNAVVDPSAVVAAPVDALASAAPVEGVPVEAAAIDSNAVVDPNAAAMPAPADMSVPVDSTVATPSVEGATVSINAPIPIVAAGFGVTDEDTNENTSEFNPADIAAPVDALASAAPVEGVPVENVNPTSGDVAPADEEVVMAYDDNLSTVTEDAPIDATVPVDPMTATEDLSTITNSIVEHATDEEMANDGTSEFNPADTGIADDLKAFTNGLPSDEEPVPEEAKEESSSEPVSEEVKEEDEVPPIVEEDAKDEIPEDEQEAPVEETKFDDAMNDGVFTNDNPVDIFSETEEDAIPFDEIEGDNKYTSATPVAIDAETVLATVDKNKNGVIDSDELMVPSGERITHRPMDEDGVSPLERSFSTDLFERRNGLDDFSYSKPVPSYGASAYSAPADFGADYSSMLTDVKPDRISYDTFQVSSGRDNIMADVARSMSELMRQNKEQRGVITQYQDKVENLESQTRILSEKYKDQTSRYETLTGKLRALDEASGRLESRNQLLESRLRDQEKIIAAQERELKILRPQVEGKQDLVRLLADARTLLGSDTTGYGYDDGDSYFRRAA